MQRVRENLLRKSIGLVDRRNLVLLYDNTSPYSIRIMQEKNLDLGWSVQSHPPFSPELEPSNIHLFHTLPNALYNKKEKKLLKLRRRLLSEICARNQRHFIEYFNIYGTHLTTNNSTSNKVFFFVSDLKIVYYNKNQSINTRLQCLGQERKNILPHGVICLEIDATH